jgi:peptidoglycan/LPS O-acetylase OafA/YrhL
MHADEPDRSPTTTMVRSADGRRLRGAPAGVAPVGRRAGVLHGYSPGIDGLRAVAVAAVLAYHAELPWAGGGFLGVSLFFTLSGFLITSVLLRSHDGADGIRLASFWARRYRRLLPAACVALAGVVAFGATVATEQQLRDLPGGVGAALAQCANWYFVLTGQSYAEQFSAPSPVAHFWSLAVEEQFYLVMPLVLLVLLRLSRSLRVVAVAVGGLALASSALMAVLFEAGASIDRLYFGTDTRAAELLVGCVLALVLHEAPLRLAPEPARVLGGAGVVASGVTLACWAGVSLTDSALYRGGFLAIALLSGVVITSIVAQSGPVAKVLAWSPLAAVGRISYGLYLFHWPVYLWLDADRTGLGPTPLLLLRLAVTVAAATVSYHLVEMPVRNGAWRASRPRLGWVVVPGAAVVVTGALLAGAVVASQREVVTDLAGLGEPVPTPPSRPAETVAEVDDRVLDVVVVADEWGAGTAHGMAAWAASVSDVTVTVASPWSCEGVDPAARRPVCTNWEREWPGLVRRHAPDVVVLHVTAWDLAPLVPLTDPGEPGEPSRWALEVLGAGVDLLAAEGATVVWARAPVDVATTVAQQSDPFHRALGQLAVSRPEVRTLQVPRTDAAELVADLRPYQRRSADGIPRVLVVGDSVARTVGYGLERWGAEHGAALVWSSGTEGCGIADDGAVRDLTGRERELPEPCRAVWSNWQEQVASFDPDIVVVLSTAWDLQERRLPGWPRFLGPGDTAFDDYLVEEYTAAFDALSQGGAAVVWLHVPCARDKLGLVGGAGAGRALAPERVRHANEAILLRLAAARPDLGTFDLFGVLCPGGEYADDVGGVSGIRPDGVHLSAEGSLWLAAEHGPAMLAAGLGPSVPPHVQTADLIFP